MKFSIPLPTDPLYCPKLSCTVYDNIFKGWNQPMVGVFTVPIGTLMIELKDERTRETAAIEEINEKLEQILNQADLQPKSYGVNKGKANEDSMDEITEEQIGQSVVRKVVESEY